MVQSLRQKYFLVLWLWWSALICLSTMGLLYRVARIAVPDISRSMLLNKVSARSLERVDLSGSDCFMLDMLATNLPHTVMEQVRNTHSIL